MLPLLAEDSSKKIKWMIHVWLEKPGKKYKHSFMTCSLYNTKGMNSVSSYESVVSMNRMLP